MIELLQAKNVLPQSEASPQQLRELKTIFCEWIERIFPRDVDYAIDAPVFEEVTICTRLAGFCNKSHISRPITIEL